MDINTEQCNRDIRTYGDVIRHMTNDELSLFLYEMDAEIERGILALMRAKIYTHRRYGVDGQVDISENRPNFHKYDRFLERRLKEEPKNYADIWGVKNWQDLMQWESEHKKNFGEGVVY